MNITLFFDSCVFLAMFCFGVSGGQECLVHCSGSIGDAVDPPGLAPLDNYSLDRVIGEWSS